MQTAYQALQPPRYYELRERDIVKFGFSTREYVILHERSEGVMDTESWSFGRPPSCEYAGHILSAYLWLQSSTFDMEWNFWRNVGYSQILVKSVFFNIPWLLINIAVVGVSPNTSICFMTTFTIGSNTQWLLFLWFVVNTRNRGVFLVNRSV